MSVLIRQPSKIEDLSEKAHTLRMALVRLQRRLRAARGDISIGLSAFSALACIHQYGPLSAGELAARERLQPQSLTRILARLERETFISRRQDKRDLRRARLLITPKGKAYLRANGLDQEAWLSRAMSEALSPSERAMLAIAAQLLDRLAVVE